LLILEGNNTVRQLSFTQRKVDFIVVNHINPLEHLEGSNTVRQHSFMQRKVDFIVVDHINPLEHKEFDHSLDFTNIGHFA